MTYGVRPGQLGGQRSRSLRARRSFAPAALALALVPTPVPGAATSLIHIRPDGDVSRDGATGAFLRDTRLGRTLQLDIAPDGCEPSTGRSERGFPVPTQILNAQISTSGESVEHPEHIREIRVLETIVGGRTIYEARE